MRSVTDFNISLEGGGGEWLIYGWLLSNVFGGSFNTSGFPSVISWWRGGERLWLVTDLILLSLCDVLVRSHSSKNSCQHLA